MTKRARRRKLWTKVYWISLFIWTLLLIGAAAFGLNLVWRYAEEYENARPNHVIDAYVDEINRNHWVDGIDEAISKMPHEMQTDEECAERVKELLSEGITYTRQGSADAGNSINYSLRCGNGNVFGKVTLVEDTGKADELKFKTLLPWKISNVEFDFNGLYTSVETVVPKMYSVYLNDNLLGEEYIVETDIPYDVLEPYYEDFGGLPTKVRYKYDNCIGVLEPVIKDADGNVVVIDETQDDSQFIVPCSEDMLERLSNFSVAYIDRYLRFTSGVSDPMTAYKQLSGYVVAGTEFDTYLKDMMDGLSYGHTQSYRLDSAVLNGALDLGDGYYMCDVTANYTVFYPGRGEESGVSNLRIICVDNDGDIRTISQELY